MVKVKERFNVDFAFNQRSLRERLERHNWDSRALQPYVVNGKTFVSYMDDDGKLRRRLISNAPTSYTRDAWIRVQETLIRSTRTNLRVVNDLVAAGLTYTVPEGMGVTRLEESVMSDVGEARFTMEPMAKSRRDRPEVTVRHHPLPLVTADLSFAARQLAISRNGRNRIPIDTTMLEMNTRKMWEKVEGLFVGTETFSFAGDTIYGLTNHPQRVTATLTLPTAPGWTPQVLYDEILAGIQDLADMEFSGPYGVYYSRAWGQYFNGMFSDVYGAGTLLNNLRNIEGISWWRQLDSLGTGFKLVMFQLSSDVIRVVNITPLRLINWNTMGGLAEHWKLLMGIVPQLRTNADNEIGLWHGVGA